MNKRVLTFALFFAALMISPRLVEPAYYGFLVAFVALLLVQSEWHGIPMQLRVGVSLRTLFYALVTLLIAGVTLSHGPALRDLLRDLGAMFAFFVGRHLFVAYRGKDLQTEALEALSAMGVMVSIATIIAALVAFAAGASAYIWRGEYVPFAHQWIPFALIANIYLAEIDPATARKRILYAMLCFCATVASLSRTDLLLEIVFGLAMLYRFRRELLLRFAGLLKIGTALAVLALFAPLLLQLDVVQSRIARGVGEGDQSVGWRLMEHIALYDHFVRGTTAETLFGFGLGARVPLPPGIVDFNNNTSIPTLHDSFGTIALKCGAFGVLLVIGYIVATWRRSQAFKDAPGAPLRSAGRWIVLICLGKALTLHGLTEWSQVVIFGIGCMLMLTNTRIEQSAQAPAPAALSP